jgi:HK97 family phage major capsid protein/HK97 family phage prohead protease
MSTVHKTAAGKVAGSLTFVLSDATVDRYGDIIEPTGWDLKWFKKNPIALFGHQSSFPIGTWANTRVEDGKLKAEFQPAQRGTSERVDEINSLIEQDILRATSVGFRPVLDEPIDKDKPHRGTRFLKQELLETSIVTVPANPAALQVAKSLGVSEETLELAFGKHAETGRNRALTGEQADTKTADQGASHREPRPRPKAKTMTLAEKIQSIQDEIVVKRDLLTELNSVDGELDVEAVEEVNARIDALERDLTARKASEARIGAGAVTSAPTATVPAQPRRPLSIGSKEVTGMDLLVKAMTARGVAHFDGTGKTLDQALAERYHGQDAVAFIAKADQTIGTTTVSGWASELLVTVNNGFLQALQPFSIYPALRAGGIGLSFDGIGSVSIPSRTAGGAGGGFVAEGSPIRVGRITTAATTMTPKKLGVIVPFSRELAKRSTPAIEGLVRQAILEDTAAILDAALIDATAASTARPAGLLNGVAAVATGFPGADYQAVIKDIQALLAPFYAANAADGITLLINPAQGLSLAMMPGPGAAGVLGWAQPLLDRFRMIESTNVPAGRLIALRNADFATALGDAPEFDISETATVHMDDVTPLEIVSGTPTVADPVRSFYQTATIGVRMLLDLSWKMRRSGMVQWVDSVSW